jgi:hypothetical protein
VLPGLLGSGDVGLPGTGVKLLGVPGSGDVGLPGTGVKLLGVPGSGDVGLPGTGVKLPGVPGSGGVMFSGAGVVLLGLVLPSEGVVSGTVVLPGVLGVTAVPPGQRELRGERSHRILNPSGDKLISVGVLVDWLLDWAIRDLLEDWATAILVESAKVRAVPIRVRDFPIILKLTSTELSAH